MEKNGLRNVRNAMVFGTLSLLLAISIIAGEAISAGIWGISLGVFTTVFLMEGEKNE